jgi:methyl-accepting chemotaxis protein
MSAMYATTDAQRQKYGVEEVADHAKTILRCTTRRGPGAGEPARRSTPRAPRLQVYADTASALVATAATDHAKAESGARGYLRSTRSSRRSSARWTTHAQAVQAASDTGVVQGPSSNVIIVLAGRWRALITRAGRLLTLRAIRRPLREMRERLRAAADCDLTVGCRCVRRDELGEMAGALNEAMGAMQDTWRRPRRAVGTLSAASADLRTLAGDLDSSAEQTSAQARSADVAAHNVSSR